MEKTDGQGRSIIARGIVMGFMLLACCPCAFALNPALDISQYAHTSWKIRDGFPKGQVTSIAQTQDGYLWLGTEFGLVRFDGVKHIPWQWPQDQQLPSSLISGLLATRDGTLWIGTLQGLASWKDGKVTQYPELAGRVVFRLLEDHDGTLWATGLGVTGGKLCAIRSGSIHCYGEDGSLGRGPFGLFEDSKGTVWAGVKDGLWRWKPGPPKFFPLPGAPDGIQGLAEDDDGSLLIGWNGGIQRFVDGKTEPYPISGAAGQFWGRRLLRDRDGGMWIGTGERGLVHMYQGRTDVFAPLDGLSGPNVYSLFEDREGSIWVSTIDGLDRFREFAVATHTARQGLPNPSVGSVLADRDGSVWFATRGGLGRWINGQFTSSPTSSAQSDGKSTELRPHSLFQDDSGRIWASTQSAFRYLENDRFISVGGVPGGVVTGIAQDTVGSLWIANEPTALFQLLRGSLVQQIPWSRFGMNAHGSTLAADPLQGGIWIGFHLGGISYLTDGQVRASYTAADGLAEGRVNHLLFDKRRALWISTAGGLSRLKDGRISTLTSKNGLPCDSISWAMEDDDHSYWLYSACGLVRIAGTELDAWAEGSDLDKDGTNTIHATVFDLSDGVRTLALGGHYSPQVAKSSDGRLWFLPWDGVSVVDPRHIPFNPVPPPVHIEQVTADRKTYATLDSSGRLTLPPSIRDLQIDYTALSLVAPEKVLFRYKLEDHDRDWQDVGNRRQAFYNDLPPGNYRFRVVACNNNGVWNEAGTFLDFSISPAYYQTLWFRFAVVAALVLLLAAGYQLRVRHVAQQVRERMEERLEERERIARDLHDTLLQSVQGLILKFHAVAKQISPDAAAHDALEKTLDRADQVMAEGRDRVRSLRVGGESLTDLSAAFKRIAEEAPLGRRASFKTVLEGSPRPLHPLALEESYCIGREALINALTHSGGDHVEIEITYDPRQFRLRVRDDGRGIDQNILEEGGRPDHWGMQGMRERANKIGAELKLWSGHETGTEVELIVPGSTAYQAAGAHSKGSWLRRLSRGGS